MVRKILRIATRGSELALWQAEHVKARLQACHPGLEVELVILKTRGDKILDVPLAKVGGKGLFVKELETALLEERADIAVHSMKDVPMALPEGLGIAVICERENPLDALVSNQYASLGALPQGAIVGTSSLRRQCHLQALRPDLEIRFLRGNVNTRLAKLDAGQYQAIILAAAGLIRLGKEDRIREILPADESLPAAGQGAIGIECRAQDIDSIALLKPLHHRDTAICVSAERAVSRYLNGGCQVPIAAYAMFEPDDQLWLRGIVADPDSGKVLFAQRRASAKEHERLGEALAQELITQGADQILERLYQSKDRNPAEQ